MTLLKRQENGRKNPWLYAFIGDNKTQKPSQHIILGDPILISFCDF